MTDRPRRVGLLRMCELPEYSHAVHGPYVTLYAMLFDGHPVELLDVPVHEGATPASLGDADVWLITGSPASVYDDLDWIRTAEELVRSAAASEAPLVGICFGHQLIAQALGGSVQRSSNGWGIGAHRYETVERVGTLDDLPRTLTLLASHQDQVVVAPADAVVWSTADYCPIAGLAVGERIWSVQGHPEFTVPLVRALYQARRDLMGADVVDTALATLDRPLTSREIARAILR